MKQLHRRVVVTGLGILSPIGINEWSLKAEIRATIKQKCIISLEPVQTIIHEKINSGKRTHEIDIVLFMFFESLNLEPIK